MLNLSLFFLKFCIIGASSVVLAYISMAASVGPWISPAIILASNVIFIKLPWIEKHTHFGLINQIGASVAGLIATAIGFSLPTLYFLDSAEFKLFIASPVSFCLNIGLLILAGATLGWTLIQLLGNYFLSQSQNIPTSKLFVQSNRQSLEPQTQKSAALGLSLAAMLCLLRDGIAFGSKIILQKITLLSFFIRPTMWAVGYILGKNIILPLVVGLILNFGFINKIAAHPNHFGLPLTTNNPASLAMAFCAGILVFELIYGLFSSIKKLNLDNAGQLKLLQFTNTINGSKILATFCAIIFCGLVLQKFDFSLQATAFIIFGSIVAGIEITKFLIEYGMVPFGRFTTFVMIPALGFFPITPLQTTVLCLFVALTAAATTGFLLQHGVGANADIESNTIKSEFWQGIIISSILMGGIFWLLLSNLQLGSAELFAQRGKMRAMLIATNSFDKIFTGFGFVFSVIAQATGLSVSMLFGGLLMPLELSAGLIAGASLRAAATKTPALENFWTGSFVGEAILVTILLGLKLTGLFFGY